MLISELAFGIFWRSFVTLIASPNYYVRSIPTRTWSSRC